MPGPRLSVVPMAGPCLPAHNKLVPGEELPYILLYVSQAWCQLFTIITTYIDETTQVNRLEFWQHQQTEDFEWSWYALVQGMHPSDIYDMLMQQRNAVDSIAQVPKWGCEFNTSTINIHEFWKMPQVNNLLSSKQVLHL